MRPQYRDLYFGMSDSRNEASMHNEEFVKSYVDMGGICNSIIDGQKFLVLGPKGTGKSALAWYLRLTEPRGTHLAEVLDASVLPLAEIPRLQTGQDAGPERTVIAWRFVLLCNYLQLLLRDQSCSLNSDGEVARVAKLLREYGFMSDASGKALVNISTTTISIPIPRMGEIYKKELKSSLNIYNLVPYLESWVASATSNVRHILLLDGLDSILLNDEKYDESLASLVQAAYTLNQRLLAHESTGSVVLLLRNDVFARIALSLPDSQKMRDDLSIQLDWRVLSGSAGISSPLLRLVDTKASRALGTKAIDVMGYFPSNIRIGERGRNPSQVPALRYLLNMTRHTPRDLLRLFEEIRKVEADASLIDSDRRLREDVVHEGVLRYSADYFIGAVRNEFAGFEEGPEAAGIAISALKSLEKQEFDRNEFRKALSDASPGVSLNDERLLELLFFAGAIGNVRWRRSERYMTFYHRRDESEMYLRGQFILHNALIHAWGMPYGGR